MSLNPELPSRPHEDPLKEEVQARMSRIKQMLQEGTDVDTVYHDLRELDSAVAALDDAVLRERALALRADADARFT